MPQANDRLIFLSTVPATRRDRRTAGAVVGASALLFACAAPFASVKLAPYPAFVASYQSALAVSDFITAILLFSQFAILRWRGLLLLGCGYLFTGGAALAHALSFPGLFAQTGLLGSGPQTTVWLFMIWHAVFPVLVLVHAVLSRDNGATKPRTSAAAEILAGIAAVIVGVLIAEWAVTAQHDVLPVLLHDGRYTPVMIGIVTTVWSLSLLALIALWLRKSQTVLDLWLMVVMCAWLFDIAMSAIINTERYDLGFYLGRIYGLSAASFVLAVLLFDNVKLTARLSGMLSATRREADTARIKYSERERLFSAVVEASNDAIITKSLDGTITAWNPAAEHLFGYTAAEAVGQKINLIVPPDLHSEEEEILRRIAAGGKISHHETVRQHKSGREVEVSLSIQAIRSASGEIIGAAKTAHDVTEVRRTQRELHRQMEERQRIFETSTDLIVVTDRQGNFVQVSPSALAVIGYEPAEMVGRNTIEFIHPGDLEAARTQMRAARRGEKRIFEARYVHKDGHDVMLSWTDSWSEPVQRHFFIGRDLTDIRSAEAQVRQAQKMDAIGQLTGGVAHDFNNILTVITGTISILADAVSDQPDLVEIARMIDDAADRGANLTKHLLAFARKQPLEPREIDVNALVLEAAKLLHPTLGEHIQITPMLAVDAWSAQADPNQLTTAVLNLAINARDAMPSGGKLVLETNNSFLDEVYASHHNEVVPGEYVMIAISDTGTGIAPADLERVFEPFFTTKEVGKGTGLGLSMVFGFVKQSGGHVKIYSELGHGTTVKIYLPRASGVGQAAVAAAPATIEGGNETILVVEDDALVRRYVLTQIQSLGYNTLEASNATEALELIDTHLEIDLLFTDVIMPGPMNGRQLALEAQRRVPRLKALYTSGYTENAIVHHGRLDSGVLLLAKPYRKSELARMIRVALAS